jgi:hypothetical protein
MTLGLRAREAFAVNLTSHFPSTKSILLKHQYRTYGIWPQGHRQKIEQNVVNTTCHLHNSTGSEQLDYPTLCYNETNKLGYPTLVAHNHISDICNTAHNSKHEKTEMRPQPHNAITFPTHISNTKDFHFDSVH